MLRQAGKYCDLSELWLYTDSVVDKVNLSVHTAANARLVHDALMLLLCFRENPVTRPTCVRLLLQPGVLEDCSICEVGGCLGNSWQGMTAVFSHYKTASTYGQHTIKVQPGSRTELFLQNYTDWARPLLVQEDTNALFLNVRGRAFYSDGSFNKYLPRLLAGCAKLSWTKVI
jgi:hypothetical protein